MAEIRDIDPIETHEWTDAIEGVIEVDVVDRQICELGAMAGDAAATS